MIPGALLGLAGRLVGGLVKKKLRDTVPPEVLETVASAAQELRPEDVERDPEAQMLATEISENFLDYFGRFEQLPRSVQIARALQRPVVTVLFSGAYIGIVVYALAAGHIAGGEALAAIGGPVTLVVGFLFGERAALKKPGGQS